MNPQSPNVIAAANQAAPQAGAAPKPANNLAGAPTRQDFHTFVKVAQYLASNAPTHKLGVIALQLVQSITQPQSPQAGGVPPQGPQGPPPMSPPMNTVQ